MLQAHYRDYGKFHFARSVLVLHNVSARSYAALPAPEPALPAVEAPGCVCLAGCCPACARLALLGLSGPPDPPPLSGLASRDSRELANPPSVCLLAVQVAHQGRGPMDDLSFLEVPEHYRELFRWAAPAPSRYPFPAPCRCPLERPSLPRVLLCASALPATPHEGRQGSRLPCTIGPAVLCSARALGCHASLPKRYSPAHCAARDRH